MHFPETLVCANRHKRTLANTPHLWSRQSSFRCCCSPTAFMRENCHPGSAAEGAWVKGEASPCAPPNGRPGRPQQDTRPDQPVTRSAVHRAGGGTRAQGALGTPQTLSKPWDSRYERTNHCNERPGRRRDPSKRSSQVGEETVVGLKEGADCGIGNICPQVNSSASQARVGGFARESSE